MTLRPQRVGRRQKWKRARLNSRKRYSDWTWQDTKRVWKGFDPTKHKLGLLALLFVGLSIGLGAWAADPSNSLFHSYRQASTCLHDVQTAPGGACNDPITNVWADPSANGLASLNFAGPRISEKTGVNCVPQSNANDLCISVDPFNGNSDVLIEKNPVGSLAIADGKTLGFNMNWGDGVNCGADSCRGSSNYWGWFLTTNNTVPNHAITTGGTCGMPMSLSCATYDPFYDKNVVLTTQTFQALGSGNTYTTDFYELKHTGESIQSESTGGCSAASSLILCSTQTGINSASNWVFSDLYLNYSGAANASPSGCQVVTNVVLGAGCTWGVVEAVNQNVLANAVTQVPQILQTGDLYFGMYDLGTSGTAGWQLQFSFDTLYAAAPGCNNGNCYGGMDIFVYNTGPASTVAPNIDTGGFFGPVIKALINIGVYILNALLAFIAFIAPALQTAVNFMETQITGLLNLIGNALGFGNIGTSLANFLNAMINFFTNQLPQYIGDFPSYVTNFLSLLTIEFPFLAPIFTIANAILAFGVAGIAKAIAIFTIGLQMFLYGFGTLMVAAYFIYVGDDAAGGLFTYLGTLEAVAFKLLNIIAMITNLGLDLIVHVISLIPKPVIQMSAGHLPRLPTVDSTATMTWPSFNFAEAFRGNMVVFWLWSIGLYFSAWFESQNPALPGSIVALDPALASNIRIVSGFLPMLQAFVLVSGGLLALWILMLPLQMVGVYMSDLPVIERFGVGTGRQKGPGPGGIRFHAGKKHLIGTPRRIQAQLDAAKLAKKERVKNETTAKQSGASSQGVG